MKQFTSTKFFCTLQDASQKGIDKNTNTLQNEYDDFANSVFLESSYTGDKTVYRNKLVFTRVELSALTGVLGKKCNNLSQESH